MLTSNRAHHTQLRRYGLRPPSVVELQEQFHLSAKISCIVSETALRIHHLAPSLYNVNMQTRTFYREVYGILLDRAKEEYWQRQLEPRPPTSFSAQVFQNKDGGFEANREVLRKYAPAERRDSSANGLPVISCYSVSQQALFPRILGQTANALQAFYGRLIPHVKQSAESTQTALAIHIVETFYRRNLLILKPGERDETMARLYPVSCLSTATLPSWRTCGSQSSK